MEQKDFKLKFIGHEIKCKYIKDKAQAQKTLNYFMGRDVLFGLDTETAPLPQFSKVVKAGLSPHLAYIRLLQVYDGVLSVVFDLSAIDCDEIFLPFLESKRFIAHYAKFDLGMFKETMGVKKMNVGCTQILYRIISHAVYPIDIGGASLEELTETILKTPMLKKAQKSDWSKPDLTFEQVTYAALDPVACLMIAKKLAPSLQTHGLEKTYNLLKEVQHPIVEMQLNGMLLDKKKHFEQSYIWKLEKEKVGHNLRQMLGLTRLTDNEVGKWLENNLPEDVLAIWPCSEKTGKLSTSADAFAEHSHLPIVAPLSEYKQKVKLCSSFGLPLLNKINQATGRIHTNFNISGARTGRLSSSQPNLQQYPRDKKLRAHWIPGEGKVFVCADYSQIEVRVAAEISRDKKMLSIYRDGIDIYRATAAALNKCSLDEVTGDQRQHAKAIVLGLLFGLGAGAFGHYALKNYGVNVSPRESSKSVQGFRELYPEFRKWQLNQNATCKKSLVVFTLGGKKRCLAEDKVHGASMNTPVQGTAAEVIQHALIKLYHDFKDTEVKLINCVHDEIVTECAPEIAEDVKELKNIRMIEAYQEMFPDGVTRGLVEAGIGTSWGESKK